MSFGRWCAVALVISVLAVLASIILAIEARRARRLGTRCEESGPAPLHILIIGCFVGVATLLMPIYYADYFRGEEFIFRLFKSVLLSVHNTMRVFILDGDFDIIENAIMEAGRMNPVISYAYTAYGAVLFVAAPIMTASFVLSFFKNVSAHLRYAFCRAERIYYMSELNERSLSLAENILSEDHRASVVFYSVKDDEGEESAHASDARRIGAICFRREITEGDLKPKSRRVRKLYFISDNEDKNLREALEILPTCRGEIRLNTPNTQFYVFADSPESEILLDAADNGNMKLRRVSMSRKLAINTICDMPVFNRYTEVDGLKRVTAVVLGGGKHGVEMAKALIWAGQLPGYDINVHIFDKDKLAREKFNALCPELVDMSGVVVEGEPRYTVTVHPDVDVESESFTKAIESIDGINLAFVTLGDDGRNIGAAIALRRLLARGRNMRGQGYADIYSVVNSPKKNDVLMQSGGLLCLGEADYGIEFIGDVLSTYSVRAIEQTELEARGLEIHLSWLEHEKKNIMKAGGDPAEINRRIEKSRVAYDHYEYFRHSSIATAVHISVMDRLNISFEREADKSVIEHNRWSAYMRAEGYVLDRNHKDHIAKTHTDLRPFDQLGKGKQAMDTISAKVRESK